MSAKDKKNQPGKTSPLSPAAQRALEEANKRRAKRDGQNISHPQEVDGREGLEPTRYGDWEKNGILSDF